MNEFSGIRIVSWNPPFTRKMTGSGHNDSIGNFGGTVPD